MWKHREGIRIEGPFLTCKDVEETEKYGARYLKPFTEELPHFEVVILETGERRWLGIGVVHEDYDTSKMPGWYEGTLGYHSDDGKIFHGSNDGKETKGPVLAHQGDRIRCTAMFEHKKVNNGKEQVPVLFTLNGRKMITQKGENQFFMDSDKPLYPYVGMTDGCIVLAKMFPREICKIEDLHTKVTKSLEKTNQQINSVLEEFKTSKMEDLDVINDLDRKYKESLEKTNQKFNNLLEEVEKNRERLEETNQKLDALLAKLTDGSC